MQKFRRMRLGIATTCAALLALGVTTGMSPYRSVTVSVDGKVTTGGTYATESVVKYLASQHVHVAGYDLVEPARATLLQNGMKIVVVRALPILLTVGNHRPTVVHTLVHNVGDLLHQLRIKLGPEDSVSAPLRAPLTRGMKVRVIRGRSVVQSMMQSIAYSTIRQSSNNFVTGTNVVARQGQNGLVRVTVTKYFRNNRLVRSVRHQTVIRQPVSELIDVGTAQPAPTPAPVVSSRSDSSLVTSQVVTMIATAYSNPGGRTATGQPAGYGDIAVDPSVIPLGTKLYIPGYGYGVADDTGGAIQGYRIDLCFNSVSQAIDYGRQVVQVYILGK